MDIDELIDVLHEKVRRHNDYFEKCFDYRDNKGLYTLWLCGLAVIGVPKNNKGKTISIPNKYLPLFDLDHDGYTIKTQALWTTLVFNQEVAINIAENIITVFETCFTDSATESFGCCSRYLECSNEKFCVHPEKEEARGCMYKINLDGGRIFYGKNRNID